MGSSSSRPQAPVTTNTAEKRNSILAPLPSPSSHHATDRLMRISAEAATSSRPQHQSNMPEHDTTQAAIKLTSLKAWDVVALEDPTSRLAAMTLHNTVIKDSIRRRRAEVADHHIFSHTIPSQGTPIVNQMSSGRCWLFATTNVIRLQVIKELNLQDFELSQSYLAFWDKLEKSNTFLENSIDLADRPLDDRVFGFLKTAPTNDGGQWDMVTNLIKKYGLVPKDIFPESYNSSNSSQINWLLTVKLREYALELRQLKRDTACALEKSVSAATRSQKDDYIMKAVRSRKDQQMAEVYRMMVIALGVPPKPEDSFTFEFYDKTNKYHSITTTPLEFVDKYTGSFDPSGACSLVNDPRHQYGKLITVDRLQNVWGGQPVLYVNTAVQQMKDCVVASIKAGLPVFFGCDVGQFSARTGIMDTDLYDFELAFGIKLRLTKAERLEMGESSMTHAMVITGVHLDGQGKPVRYRVENSWGPDAGNKGYMVMSDKWFDEFVYQVVIRKQHMPTKLWTLFSAGVDHDTIVLPPYDPMGSLAPSSNGEMEVDAAPGGADDASDAGQAGEGAKTEESDIPEDEYEIEAILSHSLGHFGKKNEIAYLVSWKGYGPEHNSWVTEGDAENAPEMINGYWANADKAGVVKKANGRGWTGAKSTKRGIKKESPVEPSNGNSSRPRSRRNNGAVGSTSQDEVSTRKRSKLAGQASYSRPGIDIVDASSYDDDDADLTEKQIKSLDSEEQARHKRKVATKLYQKMADWEGVVRHVETVERIANGKLIVFLIFDNGERYAYESAVVNHRCPQKMISFYESRLRFKVDAATLPPLHQETSAKQTDGTDEAGAGGEAAEEESTLPEAEASEPHESVSAVLENGGTSSDADVTAIERQVASFDDTAVADVVHAQ